MNVEILRTVAAYAIALVVILGGGWLLVTPSQVPPDQLLPFLTGTIGGVLTWVFSERQVSAANKAAGNGVSTAITKAELDALHKRLDATGIPREGASG